MDLAITPHEARHTAEPVRAWSTLASLGLHAALLAALVLLLSPHLAEPPVRSVAVDILTQDQFELLSAPPVPTPPAEQAGIPMAERPSTSQPQPPADPAPELVEGGMVRATHFFAADILNDPANAEIRDTLPLFAVDEQIVQLCNMEALEQVADWRATMHPDALVPYAFAETRLADGVLQADGGAFRDAGQWYAIRYRCGVGADRQSVASFEFAVGDLIPPDQWDAHFLNASDDALD